MHEQATKDQYEFFRALYDEEERTSVQLEGRAKVYLGVLTAFLAAIVFKAGDARQMATTLHIPWILLLLEALAMTVGLSLVLWALRIRDYEAVNDGVDLLAGYVGQWPTSAQFFEDRIADYSVASSINRGLNNEMAGLLAWASWCMTGGMIMLIAIVVCAIWRS